MKIVFLFIFFFYNFLENYTKFVKNNILFPKVNLTKHLSKYNHKYNIKINNSFSDIKSKKKKNLIIVAIVNYDWKTIELFFKSYKQSGFTNCDLVAYIDNMNNYAINKIKGIPLINYRWKIYYDHINDNKNKYELILTTDVRDSFFQLVRIKKVLHIIIYIKNIKFNF
jgi:hypothetical protein